MFGETVFSYPVYITNNNFTEISNLLDVLGTGYKKAYVGDKWAAVKEFGNGYGITIKDVDMDYNNFNEITGVDIYFWSGDNPNSDFSKVVKDVKIADVENTVKELQDLSNKAIEVETKMYNIPVGNKSTNCYMVLDLNEKMSFEDEDHNKVVVTMADLGGGPTGKRRERFVVDTYGDVEVVKDMSDGTDKYKGIKYNIDIIPVAIFGDGDKICDVSTCYGSGVVVYKHMGKNIKYTVSVFGNVEVAKNSKDCW